MNDMYKNIIGQQIHRIDLSADKTLIEFVLQNGMTQAFRVKGDCCSHSWVEHIETPNDVDGATVLSVSDSGGVEATSDDGKNPVVGDDGHREHECLQVYQTIFRTDRGDISIEYRNSSNGYYGGYIEDGGYYVTGSKR